MTLLRRAARAWIVFVLALVAVQSLAPQRSGPLALTEVLEPLIVLTAIAAAPLALVRPDRLGLTVIGALVVAVLVRYGPGFAPQIGAPISPRLTVTTWNVEAGENSGQRVLEGLSADDDDLVALEELQPSMAQAVTSDSRLVGIYPFHALAPDSSVLGVGLLSRYPIVEQFSSSDPPYLRAVVDLPTGRTAVFVVHPLPGRFQTVLHVPIGLDTSTRDTSIATIRAAIDADLASGLPTLVMGDSNTTPREPAYAQLSAGLLDARAAGSWPGVTWRWGPFKELPFGMLRIDYAFSSPGLVPVSYSVRCTDLSDHCILSAGFR